MKRVQFDKHYRIYNIGEKAGFDDAEAEDIVQRGIGHIVPYDEAEAAPAPLGGSAEGPRRRVQFTKAYGIYNVGEKAGFPADQAADIVERGIGRYIRFDEDPSPPVPTIATETTKLPASPDRNAGGQSTPAALPPSDYTHGLSVDEVGKMAESIKELAQIQALIAGEKTNPKFEGGRKGALELLELRAAELAPPA